MPKLGVSLALLLCLGGSALGADLKLNSITDASVELGSSLTLEVTGTPGKAVLLVVSADPGPTILFGQSLPVGFGAGTAILDLGVIPGSGTLTLNSTIPQNEALAGQLVYLLAAVLDDGAPFGFDFSNGGSISVGSGHVDLAGNAISQYPHFQFVRAFNEGSSVSLGLDPTRYPYALGRTADIYVTTSMTSGQWDLNPTLTDVSGDGPETATFTGSTIQANTIVLDTGTLSGSAGDGLGVGYDVVIDFNQNGVYDAGDFLDGYSAESGLYVVHDTTLPGPHAVTEILYSGGTWKGQDTYYPTNIASMGQLPLVVVSHGNGHNYQWYDHIGNHLASYGYVVMSHENQTGPGTITAANTTWENTDYLIANQDTINGGVLDGHIDHTNMTWIGHSRGGEGVVRAYHFIRIGDVVPAEFVLSDITLVSSIAPTDFGGTGQTEPDAVAYHLWTGASDSDVNGCASCSLCQTFHLHDRATQFRQSISLHGVGHGDFHDGSGSAFATGPCLVGRTDTHTIMRGYLLPLVKHYIGGNIPAKDFLTRQWESFRPIGAPDANPCVTVDLMYREGASAGKFVIDDFQSNPSTALSSSGGSVSFTVSSLSEGLNDDNNTAFTNSASDAFNSVTLGENSDSSAGIAFQYDSADADITWEILAADKDFRPYRSLAFRGAQLSRHPLTTTVDADLDFEVTLRDGSGTSSTIAISSYGGGLEDPYPRTSCGTGAGWYAPFESVQIRLTDFLTNGSGLNLGDIAEVVFEFGPSHGANEGRLGLDEIELTTD